MIEIDGSFGEGGGQILRTSLALALVTGRAFHLWNIRAGRQKPGLQPQHLMSVRAAATVGQAQVRGDHKGSRELFFEPGEVRGGDYHFAIGTAGATSLVLHTVYLPLALHGQASTLTIQGGTHVSHAPCFHFLAATWSQYLERLGITLRLRMTRPGFYPRGGGILEARIEPCRQVKPLQLTRRGPVTEIHGLSAVAGLPESIAARQARRALGRLRDSDLHVDINTETWEGGPGTMLALTLNSQPVPTLFFGLGARGKPAERVADEAVDQAREYLDAGGGVDPHSADQIVLPLALAAGPSAFPVSKVTQHLLTNIAVIGYFVERTIRCEGEEGKAGVVSLE